VHQKEVMIIEILGWISTVLVLCGYWLNSNNFRYPAFVTWIMGDIGWIIYDIFIDNISHLVLSVVIISLNVWGIFQIIKKQGVSK